LGGTVYPLRDHWFAAEIGGAMLIHGPIRWFAGHTYEGSIMEDWMTRDENVDVGNTANIPEDNKKPLAATLPPNPIIAPSQNENVKPVSKDQLPTVSKLLSSIPRSTVIFCEFRMANCFPVPTNHFLIYFFQLRYWVEHSSNFNIPWYYLHRISKTIIIKR
jgi:hypothetical protein